MNGRSHFYVSIRFLFVLLTGVFLSVFPTLAPGLEPSVGVRELATTQLLKQARELLEYGKAAEAVPYLEESLIRFSRTDDPDVIAARSEASYQLGLCCLEAGQFERAAEVFRNFVADNPSHESALVARLLTLEALARLDDPDRMTGYVAELEASGEFELFAAALNDPANADTCRHALVALMQAYAQSADLVGFKRFLPLCDEEVLNDTGLNLALLEGGDLAVGQAHYLDALQFYRLVKTSGELTDSCARRLAALKAELDVAPPWVPLKARAMQQEQRSVEQQRYEALLAQREALLDPGYDVDLRVRMAQCYDAMGRKRIAIPVYQRIYSDFPDSLEAGLCRYLAFNSLLDLREFALAREEGLAYVAACPQGRFCDEVTLGLMHVELGSEDLDAADQLGRSLLDQSPAHRYLDQVNYLLGYVQFQRGDYEAAAAFFDETATVWPSRVYAEESTYWVGMCTLFLGRYERAVELFENYLNQSVWASKVFAAEVTYRLGMAYYGLENDAAAETVFSGFLEQFPASDLVSEVCSMLGDLHGAAGDLPLALEEYRRARESAVNPGQFDYAVFQAAKACELLGRYQPIVDLMTDYLNAPEPRGTRFAEAGLALSRAYRSLGEPEKALDVCCDTLVRFGNDPQAVGIGSVIDGILLAVRDPEQGSHFLALAKNRLGPERVTGSEGAETLGLYLTVLFSEWSDGAEREACLDSLLSETRFDAFAPLTLVHFAAAALDRGDTRRVRQAFDYFSRTFAASDRAPEMANLAVSAFIADGEYPEALALAQKTLDLDPDGPVAAATHLLAGDSLRLMADYELAIEMYSKLLKVRAWRGPLTPQALYWIAVCKKGQGDVEQAFAYFQRVYVLYSQYPEWVARAYAGSVECLRALGREEEIAKTWREMLAIPEVARRPEGIAAQAGLDALPGKIQ